MNNIITYIFMWTTVFYYNLVKKQYLGLEDNAIPGSNVFSSIGRSSLSVSNFTNIMEYTSVLLGIKVSKITKLIDASKSAMATYLLKTDNERLQKSYNDLYYAPSVYGRDVTIMDGLNVVAFYIGGLDGIVFVDSKLKLYGFKKLITTNIVVNDDGTKSIAITYLNESDNIKYIIQNGSGKYVNDPRTKSAIDYFNSNGVVGEERFGASNRPGDIVKHYIDSEGDRIIRVVNTIHNLSYSLYAPFKISNVYIKDDIMYISSLDDGEIIGYMLHLKLDSYANCRLSDVSYDIDVVFSALVKEYKESRMLIVDYDDDNSGVVIICQDDDENLDSYIFKNI